MLRRGADYTAALPSYGCAEWDDTVKLLPGDNGLAFAMFAFNVLHFGGDRTFNVGLTAGTEDTWFGVANRRLDCWEWHDLSQGTAVELSGQADYVDAEGIIATAVVTTKPAIVEWVCLGTVNVPGPPELLFMTPTMAGAGEQVEVRAEVKGTRPLSFTWEVASGDAQISDPHSPTPTITFGSAPGTEIKVVVENEEGTTEVTTPISTLPEGSWLHTLGGWEADEFSCVVNGPDGSILAGGASGAGMFLASYGQDGSLLWQRYYECFVPDSGDTVQMANHPMSIDFGADGSIYLLTDTAIRTPTGYSSGNSSFLLKLNADGSTAWGQLLPDMNFPGAVHEHEGVITAFVTDDYFRFSTSGEQLGRRWLNGPNAHYHPNAARFNAEGELFVTGVANFSGAHQAPMVTRIGADSQMQWGKLYANDGTTMWYDVEIAPGPDGTMALAGRCDDASGQLRQYVLSLDEQGDLTFARSWRAYGQAIRSVNVDPVGNVAVCGGDYFSEWETSSFGLRLFSPAGELMQALSMDTAADSAALDTLPQADGSLVVVGAAENAAVTLVTDDVPVLDDLPTTVIDIPTELVDNDQPAQGDDMIMFSSEFVVDRGGGGRDGLVLKLTGLY